MPTGFHDCCARQGTDDRVRRTDRKAEIPGDQIPPDPSDKTAEDNVDIHHVRIDELAADGLGNSGSEDERCNEIEEGCPDDRLSRSQCSRRYYGRDGIRGI